MTFAHLDAHPAARELIVDLFAGGGGASTGIFMATGRHPDVAVNHDPEAVAQHAINHPTTKHYCCDVFELDPVEAWVVVKWASKVKPRCISLENVEEFQDWGPLDAAGKPIKALKGSIFQLWVSQLEALGYQCAWRELVAADMGAPTTRKRLSFVARRDGGSLDAPIASHAPRHRLKAPSLFDPPMEAWRSAADDVIDWSIPCPSIFDRKKDLAPKTQARIAKGVRRFVIEAKDPFILPVTHVGERPNHDVREPLKTVTSANRGELGLVDCLLTGASVGVGGRAGQSPPRGLDDPLNTVTAKGDRAIAAVSLVPRYGERDGQSPRAVDVAGPYPTVVPGGNGGGLAVAHITKFSENSTGTDLRDPLHTAMAGAPRHGLVIAHLGRQFGTAIGRDLCEPHPTVMTDGAGGKSYVAAAALTSYYGNDTLTGIDMPLPTVMTKDRHAPVVAFMEQANTGVIGHGVDQPVSTILAAGSHQRPVACDLAAPSAPSSKRAKVLAFLRKHFGEPTEAEIAAPTETVMGRLRHGLVIIGEVVWQIADIGMRMLTPRELYNAQGFPRDYIIDRTADGKVLTKTAQTRMAGNSVSPPWAAAIIAALDPLRQRVRAA